MSILFKRHFQVAYLVDDVHAAISEWSEKHGVKNWHVMDMVAMHGTPDAVSRYIALAWTDEGLMIELIEPNEAQPSIYQDWRRDSGQANRFHHLGFLVDSDEEFAAVKRRLTEAGFPIATEGAAGDMLEYAYIDTNAAFGHYYELIYLKGEGRTQFFAQVPYN